MRVISGKYKRTELNGFDIDGIRPTMDRVKEAIFAMIYDVDNKVCLDLFSGTGSIGIEALSNGAQVVYFVDNKKEAIDITKLNLSKLNATNYDVLYQNYTQALKYFSNNNIKFDIIFIDPPYGKIKIKEVIDKINEYDVLNTNGIIICEYEMEELKDNYGPLEIIKYRKYGRVFIRMYKKR